MSAPKHLWSGDWERESAEAARTRASQAASDPTDEEQIELAVEGRRVGKPSSRMVAIAVVTAIVVAAVGVVLADALGGSTKPRPVASGSPSPFQGSSAPSRTTPNGGTGLGSAAGARTTPNGAQTAPSPSQTAPNGGISPNPATGGQATPPTLTNQPTVQWLGMQIITSPTGAVVNTVQIGSEGEVAGFEPGDVIAAVAGAEVGSAREIKTAVAHVRVGGHVTVEIARGSTLITIPVTMDERPTVQP